jgi:hypothetical protein
MVVKRPWKNKHGRKTSMEVLGMSIYHCSIKNISRSSGRSAVACAAYRSGEELEDLETGITHDYRKKTGIAFAEIFLCKNAPERFQNREELWNEVEKIEKAADARLAREIEVAIPRELSLEEMKNLVAGYAKMLTEEGMCVDAAIHLKVGNPHAHLMCTTRKIKADGTWDQKEKKVYALDEFGNKIPVIDQETRKQKIGARGRRIWKRVTVAANDLNAKENVEKWRKMWSEHCNAYLEPEQQIDHRSYERQGKKDVIPTIHEGYAAREMEKRGKLAERCEINREIAAANRDIKAILAEPEPDHRTKIERQVDELLNGFEKLNKKLKEQKKILAAQSFSTPDQRAATEKIMPDGRKEERKHDQIAVGDATRPMPDQHAAVEKIMPFGSEKAENATEWSHEQETIVPNHSKEIRPNDRKEEHDQTVAERAEVVSQEEAPYPELEAQERARKRKKTEKKKKRGLRL